MERRDKRAAERSLQAILKSWEATSSHSFALKPKVHGGEPLLGRYPTDGFLISFSLGLAFPASISDLVSQDPRPQVRPLVASLDAELEELLAPQGTHLQPYWDQDGEHYSFAHHFPPIFGDEAPEQLRCFRPVQPGDPTWGSPFSDEQWVMTRYAGINMWRTVEWRPLAITTSPSLALAGAVEAT